MSAEQPIALALNFTYLTKQVGKPPGQAEGDHMLGRRHFLIRLGSMKVFVKAEAAPLLVNRK